MDNNTIIVSNNIGPGGEPADRIYGGINGKVRLVNADYSEYKGNIKKKRIIKKSAIGDYNITSYIYVTDDGRYFDRGGMPILKPDNIQEDDNENTE
tara:strand:- start:296 stop:583 length:288 start_codon:yes stop_codon:yes gene_type:complete